MSGKDHRFPTLTTRIPKCQPGFRTAGISQCTADELLVWEKDRYRFPPYQYRVIHGLKHRKFGWRILSTRERETCMGFPLDYTAECIPKGERKSNPLLLDDTRCSLLGNSWSVGVTAFLLMSLLRPFNLCARLSVVQLEERLRPGASPDLVGFLQRPHWERPRMGKATDLSISLVKKLSTLVSQKGADLLLSQEHDSLPQHQRLRVGLDPRLWKWKTVCHWQWKRVTGMLPEHIHKLELRALLSSVKWRVCRLHRAPVRFVHLVDSLVVLQASSKGRSSSRKLRRVMQRLSAWLLVSGSIMILGYVSTHLNPADEPSRRRSKRKWSSVA